MNGKLSLAAALIVGTSAAFAQQTSSAVSGKISDSKGEGLPGATVQLIFRPTNAWYGVVANDEGRYFLANLNPGGPYEITVTFVGYKTEKYTNISLKLGETQKLDVVLHNDSQLLNEVAVVGVSEEITEKTGTGTNVSREQIAALPTLSR
ncbi:MAG TPA: carboxypeptidase-like regulatory domain-containing protein, partial [Cyclobacteriaceae bacterium]|nr:carboxypeptidase-like regulatory domain-containing protein [Cyclobacteriaceae bacterium]